MPVYLDLTDGLRTKEMQVDKS